MNLLTSLAKMSTLHKPSFSCLKLSSLDIGSLHGGALRAAGVPVSWHIATKSWRSASTAAVSLATCLIIVPVVVFHPVLMVFISHSVLVLPI